jgi:phosphoribosyl 1,2-cyclic phosphodiesterase
MEMVRYGGNTSCVELRVNGQRLIFDGGTGLRVLGNQLLPQMPISGHIFFTHTQWDRIQGFPFFAPAFVEGNQFDIYGAMGQNGASIKQRLSDQMLRPNFPVPLQMMQATLRFHDILPGAVIPLGDVVVETTALQGANNALGYRVTWNGYSVVYATDTEYRPEQVDPGLLYLAHQADLLIYDAAQIESFDAAITKQQSSAWYSGIQVATAAQVKQVVLCHHDPAHEDDLLDQVMAEMQAKFSRVCLAREGMVLSLEPEELKAPGGPSTLQ